VVSGAASGIGKALSLQLLGDGANVIALDRDAGALRDRADRRPSRSDGVVELDGGLDDPLPRRGDVLGSLF